MGTKYAVDNESAGKVATDTETAIVDLDAVKTSITDPLTEAEGALPPEFAGPLAQLKMLREDHGRDVDKVKTYATGCVGALRACLTVYENSSAEMVAEQQVTESNVIFEHSSALPMSERGINDGINKSEPVKDYNKGLPSSTEGNTRKYGYEQTTTNGGDTTATHTSNSSTGKGYSTSEDTNTAANTHSGVTDTTTYYNSKSTQGGTETRVSTQNYTVAATR